MACLSKVGAVVLGCITLGFVVAIAPIVHAVGAASVPPDEASESHMNPPWDQYASQIAFDAQHFAKIGVKPLLVKRKQLPLMKQK